MVKEFLVRVTLVSATVLARCSVFGPMLLYYIRTYQLDSNSIRSFFEVLILVSEGPPSFSVATGCKPSQTVSTGMLRHPTAPQGREQPGAARSSQGQARWRNWRQQLDMSFPENDYMFRQTFETAPLWKRFNAYKSLQV